MLAALGTTTADSQPSGDFRLKDEKRAATKQELQPSIVRPADASGHSDIIHFFGPDRLIFGKALVRVGSSSERERFGAGTPRELRPARMDETVSECGYTINM